MPGRSWAYCGPNRTFLTEWEDEVTCLACLRVLRAEEEREAKRSSKARHPSNGAAGSG